MASHFKWYPDGDNVVIPWNAQYEFPSQANKTMKTTPRIPPKSGTVFTPGQVIRIELPAQGYMNTGNTTLEFDVNLQGYGTSGGSIIRFQNNIQSIFTRARLLYGSTPLEDIINYNVIVRMLTECTGTTQLGHSDAQGIANGIGGVQLGFIPGASVASPLEFSFNQSTAGLVNVRQTKIQGIDSSRNEQLMPSNFTAGYLFGMGTGYGTVPNQQVSGISAPSLNTYTGISGAVAAADTNIKPFCTRRYQISLLFGLFIQDKLIPLKFMASQLAIELTLASADECIFALQGNSSGTTPTYSVANVNLIPEILEFDSSYDAMFLRGLREGGVPIQFSSWHSYIFSTSGASTLNLSISERSRSVKALFAVQRRSPISIHTDSGATFFDTNPSPTTAGSSMNTYQYRIGGRYFPAAPVQLSTVIGGKIPNGGAEAYVELEKALNIVGDYRLSTGIDPQKWASPVFLNATGYGGPASYLNELDYTHNVANYSASGLPYQKTVTYATTTNGNSYGSMLGSSVFVASVSLETSNGVEISGLNAEEQSDISLLINWSAGQASGFVMEVYTYFDSMIVLRENNVLQLIQ